MTYTIAVLDKKHDKELFSSSVPALDQYLKTQASQEVKKNITVTYALTETDAHHVLGYYTLSSIGITSHELPAGIARKLPRYPMLPGVLLGRLAVDIKHHRKKIGSMLLIDALKRSLAVSDQIGIVAVIVDAKDESAVDFYKQFGFIELPENKRRLFLTMNTIKQLGI
jgi:predicted GNAT family N-acyltransferase